MTHEKRAHLALYAKIAKQTQQTTNSTNDGLLLSVLYVRVRVCVCVRKCLFTCNDDDVDDAKCVYVRIVGYCRLLISH